MAKKNSKTYQAPEEKPQVVEEPFVMFGTLNLDESKQYTYADYLTWIDDRRRELINGFIHNMSAPWRKHATVTMNLGFLIKFFIKRRKGKCQIFHAPFDVRLPINGATENNKIRNVVQPDICVICDPSKLDEKGCLGAPDLIVEVQSPSTMKYDMNDKFNLYEMAGVKEYWVVIPNANEVAVFLLQSNGKYDNGTVYELGQKVPVHTLKGLTIDLNELFSE